MSSLKICRIILNIFNNTTCKSGMRDFCPLSGTCLCLSIYSTNVFFHWYLFLSFMIPFYFCLFISLYAFISLYTSIFSSGETIGLNCMCYHLLKEIFYLRYLSFKLYCISIMITTKHSLGSLRVPSIRLNNFHVNSSNTQNSPWQYVLLLSPFYK